MELQVLSGVDESRLTFLAVRRWYGWSAGRIINIDIGGGSLELSNGVDEEPEVALSLPLGAGRLTREWLPDDPPGRRRVGDAARLAGHRAGRGAARGARRGRSRTSRSRRRRRSARWRDSPVPRRRAPGREGEADTDCQRTQTTHSFHL